MKRFALLATLLIGFSALAQERPIITSAIIAVDQNNDLAEAKKYIDEAAAIISTKPESEMRSKDLSKFYFYKGKINYQIYNSSDPKIKKLEPNALDKALEGFTQLLEFEKRVDDERYTDDTKPLMISVANDIAKRAYEAGQKEEYQAAYDDFMMVYELKQQDPMNTLDTNMLYNAAIMAQNTNNFEKALEINQQLMEMGYKGVTFTAVNKETGETQFFPDKRTMNIYVESGDFQDPKIEGDIRPDLYVTMSRLALANKDTALFQETVSEGRKKFPNNADLLRSELQIFLDNKEFDKALANINESVESSEGQDKVIMYYNKGVILQNEMKRYDEAIEAYNKALELDSTYSDALYMSSIIYIDSANAIGKQMNDLPLSATKKYDALKKQQSKVFEVALPYLEAAYAQSPEDKQIIAALRGVYRALGKYEKAKALPAD